jgi:hypothetical protein
MTKITNGIALMVIGAMHTHFALTEAFGAQFRVFSESAFFKISKGLDELPIQPGISQTENFAAFWFFYFGLFLFPLGLLAHSIEKQKGSLPYSFTLSYLIMVLIGCYMVPNSGMTFIMLPHALFMLIWSAYKNKKKGSKQMAAAC